MPCILYAVQACRQQSNGKGMAGHACVLPIAWQHHALKVVVFVWQPTFPLVTACKKVEEQTGSKLQPADLPRLQQQLSTLQLAHKTPAKFKILPALVQEFAEGTHEMPAVNAVLGGVLANEMLKAVSSKGTPVLNFFLYSLTDAQGVIQHHHGDKGRINFHDSKH